MKRESAARASADWKHCGFRSSKAPVWAINKVNSRGEMRLHRGDARQKTVAEPVEEVIGRAPLRRRWDRSRSRDEKAIVSAAVSAAVMVVKKHDSHLKEDRGSGGIKSELGLIRGQVRFFFEDTLPRRMELKLNLHSLEGGRGPLVLGLSVSLSGGCTTITHD